MTEQLDRKLAAVMFTDLVGYTALVQANEAQALELLSRHNKLLRSFFPKYHGREVKTIGDAFLVEFDNTLEAVNCAVEIQKFLHEYNVSAASDSWKIKLRIGIHVGDIVKRKDGDIFGDAVNIASRIQPSAEPEGVCISQQVYDQIHNKIQYPLLQLETPELKNVGYPTKIYEVVYSHAKERTRSLSPQQPQKENLSIHQLDKRKIAVLPFSNMSLDPQDAFFADGITEEIITTLSGISALSVISRTSVMGYKGTTKKVKEIGNELDVGTIVEGSFRKAGSRIRITAQLIDVASDKHLWAQSYDRNLDDVFAIQSEIAERIGEQLKIKLLGSEKEQLEKTPTKNMRAHESYLRGLHIIITGDLDRWQYSIKYLTDAIKEDPNFSLAYSALGNAYIMFGGDHIPWKVAAQKAVPLIARALHLDDNSSEAHMAKGNLAMQLHLDWETAEREFKRAIELNPSNSEAQHWYAILLLFRGNVEEAMKHAQTAVQLNPMGLTAGYVLAISHLLKQEFDEAIEIVRRMLEFEPNEALPRLFMAKLYADTKKTEQAEREVETVLQNRLNMIPMAKVLLARIYLSLGKLEDAKELLREIENESVSTHFDFVSLAPVYWALGEKDRAFQILEKALEEAPIEFLFDFRYPDYPPIREDPRYKALVGKLPYLGKPLNW